MAGQPHRPLFAPRRVTLVPQFLDELARIGADGAVEVAQRVGGTGLVAGVFVELLHLGCAVRFFAGGAQAFDFAEGRHALARREREPFGHAVAFAEAAFHTLVHDLFRRRAGLQIRDVGHRVGVQDDARVEDALRVEQRLDPLHQAVGLLAPFVLHERRHIAARAVLGLQRAVVAVDHKPDDVVHKLLVFLHFSGGREVLVEHKVEVAGQGVAEDHGVGVAVGGEHFAQPHGGLGELLDGEADVFDDGGGAAAAQARDRGQHLLAEFPHRGLFLRVGGEGPGEFGGHGGDSFRDGGHARGQVFRRGGARFDQDHTAFRADGLEEFRDAGRLVDAANAGAVDQLHGRDQVLLLEDLHGFAGQGYVRIGDHRQRLVLVVHHRVVGDVGDEGQRAFRADDQVFDNVDRVGEIDEGVERIARGILDLVFAADAGFEFRIGGNLGGDGGNPFQESRVGAAELRAGGLVARVEDRAVGQDHADVGHRLVGVLRGAAAHTAGIVGGDAADHRRVDGGGIGADLPAVFHQVGIGPSAPDARLQADLPPFLEHLPVLPAVRDDHQYGIADGLAGEGSACRPERHRDVPAVRLVEDGRDFPLVAGPDHELGDHPVERGVGAVGQGAERIMKHALLGNYRQERFVELFVFAAYHSWGIICLSSSARMSLARIVPSASSR